MDQFSSPINASFAVPFMLRLRFTRDAFGEDSHVLSELLEPTAPDRTRVQFWIDENVAAAHPDLESRIQQFMDSHRRLRLAGKVRRLPGGEAVKNDKRLLKHMLEEINGDELDRRSYVVAIGGGAVLDAVGFAAAISHRGIRLVRLPTTTLSQADSGVGVKNGMNLFRKKNWVGAFAVPWAVVNDTRLLSTLSDRDFRCGFSEVVKASALKDSGTFEELEALAPKLRARDPEATQYMINRAARLHLEHIAHGGDPFEVLEARPLDFGHWSAHKLEVMSGFELRHGEAVAIGVSIDSVYSSLKHGLPESESERILGCLLGLGLDLEHESVHRTGELFDGLEEFRQHLGGRLTLTMLTAIGSFIEVHEIDREAMLEAIEVVRTRVAGVPRLRSRNPVDLATRS